MSAAQRPSDDVDSVNPMHGAKQRKTTQKYIDPRTGVPYYVDNRGAAPRSTWTAPQHLDASGRATFTVPVAAAEYTEYTQASGASR